MADQPHERGHRKHRAQFFLAAAGLLQRGGDAAVIWFTFSPDNAALFLRGAAIGSLLVTSVLLIGVWRRLRWARYVLTGFNWAYITMFGFRVIQGWSDERSGPSGADSLLISGVLLHLGATLILVRSRRVRHFANL